MQLFDRQGTPQEVPEDKVQEALSSGHWGLPAGAKVPVKLADGTVGSVPVEHIQDAFKQGASVTSHEEYQHAALQKNYGDVAHQVEAGALGLLRGGTLGLSDEVAAGIGGEDVRKHIANVKEANPVTGGVSEAVGTLAPAFLTGGASEAVEGANLAREGVEGVQALKEASTAGKALAGAGKALATPSRLATAVGDTVERGITKLTGGEATSLAGRMSQKALSLGGRGAAEGALFGGANELDEQSLGDSELNGQKVLAAMGHGALFGAAAGGVLGAGGELGTEVVGRVAKRLTGTAEEQAFRSLDPTHAGVREADHLQGGAKAVGRRLLDDGIIQAGDKIDQIAPKVEAAANKAGERVGQLLETADAQGFAGPKVGNIFKALDDTAMKKLEMLPTLNKGAIAKVNGLREDIARAAGVPTREAAEAAGLDYEKLVDDARLGFKQAQELRRRIDDQIKWNTDPFGKPNDVAEALKSARFAMENEVEAAGDAASKKIGGSFLNEYKDAKKAYAELVTAKKISSKAMESLQARRVMSPSDYGVGLSTAAGAIASGHPLGMLGGIATGIAHHLVRERGNSTAAVMLDKLASLGAVRRAAALVDRQVDRSVAQIVGKTERALPRLKEEVFSGGYEAKRKAVLGAVHDADGHAGAIESAISPVAGHAPQTANAFQRAAIRGTVYLAQAIPKAPDAKSLTPQHEEFEPSDADKDAFAQKFDAVHDPPAVLTHVHDGTVTPVEVEALKTVHPEWYAEMSKKLIEELATTKAEIPYERKLAISMFLGIPADVTMTDDFKATMQRNWATGGPSPGPGKGPKAGGMGHPPHRQVNVSNRLGLTGLNKSPGT